MKTRITSRSCLFKTLKVLLIALAALLVVLLIAWLLLRPREGAPEVASGRVEQYEDFASRYVPGRTITVWLPDGYQVGDTCDVVYMHDGQMLFDSTTTWNRQEWHVDEVLGRMLLADSLRQCIVVGIANTRNRLIEYFPTRTCRYVPAGNRAGRDSTDLLGDAYLHFLVEELKPFIDERYRPLTSREHTFVMGSSMGGLISLYALCEYPQVFGGAACLSSHLTMVYLPIDDTDVWAHAFCDYVGHHLPPANGARVYMDHGTRGFDADYGPYQVIIDSIFTADGWDERHYRSLVFDGHDHSEDFWTRRLAPSLHFLLGRGSEP